MLNRYSTPRRFRWVYPPGWRPRACRLVVCLGLGLAALVASQPATARTLLVGPTRELSKPSEAAAIAADGDTIQIDPGSYKDCAVWSANRLIIVAAGTGVILRDRVCQNKAIFVTAGDDITIRGITFIGARAPAHNGAGVRVQGANLTLIGTVFLDNEDGILAAPNPNSTIRVLDSEFRGNGSCARECAHGIYVNRVALLDIERSRFVDQHIGHHIKSRALRTVLIDDTIMDGPDGTSSYLVDLPNGGDLLMRHCVLQKGPQSDNPVTAVSIGEEGLVNPSGRIELIDNQFRNDMANPTIFVRNVTHAPAELVGNQLSGPVVAIDGPGTVRP